MNLLEHGIDRYLVGGAVRDELLGRAIVDRDWVVVGARREDLLALGFLQVGKDFPVFLHPQTKEEHALARTERKVGQGHTGFAVHASPHVTLEEDLRRRDLTINAIAKPASGDLIDPFDGRGDLEQRVLRHVSSAFVEDPLRVFRVARFASELCDFRIAPETEALMMSMCEAGELRTLSAERVWYELAKVLRAPCPERFFAVLARCQGLTDWFPELDLERLIFSDNSSMDGDSRWTSYLVLAGATRARSTFERRLKVPGAYRNLADDWDAWHAVLLEWRSCPVSELCDALVALKVGHDLGRLTKLLSAMRAPKDRISLIELAERFARVGLGDQELSGKAYGEKLKEEQNRWLALQLG